MTDWAHERGAELWHRLREFPGVDLALVVPRTWAYLAHSQWQHIWQRADLGEVPSGRPSALLALSVFLDELMGAVMRSARLSPSHEEIWRISKEVEVALLRLEYQGALATPERFHPEPPRLERPLIETMRWYGMNYERLSFHSGYEPWAGLPGRDRWLAQQANRTARAYVLRHPGPPRPWLVCLHGFGMGYPRDLSAFRSAQLHRELGLNVIHPVFPLHGPRRVGRFSGEGVISLEFMHNVYGVAQAVWDVRRCLSWVRAQEPLAIGVHGISLGGYTAALLAGLDADLDCVIAGIPPADLARVMVRHAPRAVRSLAKGEGLFGESAPRLHSVVSPLSFEPRLPRERRFIYAGIADRMSTPQHAHMLWNHWERPTIRWYRGSHISFVWSGEVWRFVSEALSGSGIAAAPVEGV